MIKQPLNKKFKPAESYAAFWNVPVPLLRRLITCDDHRLHPYLSASGDITSKIAARQRVLSYFAKRLRHLAFHRSIAEFDASVNEFWQRNAADVFQLELMEEGGC